VTLPLRGWEQEARPPGILPLHAIWKVEFTRIDQPRQITRTKVTNVELP